MQRAHAGDVPARRDRVPGSVRTLATSYGTRFAPRIRSSRVFSFMRKTNGSGDVGRAANVHHTLRIRSDSLGSRTTRQSECPRGDGTKRAGRGGAAGRASRSFHTIRNPDDESAGRNGWNLVRRGVGISVHKCGFDGGIGAGCGEPGSVGPAVGAADGRGDRSAKCAQLISSTGRRKRPLAARGGSRGARDLEHAGYLLAAPMIRVERFSVRVFGSGDSIPARRDAPGLAITSSSRSRCRDSMPRNYPTSVDASRPEYPRCGRSSCATRSAARSSRGRRLSHRSERSTPETPRADTSVSWAGKTGRREPSALVRVSASSVAAAPGLRADEPRSSSPSR